MYKLLAAIYLDKIGNWSEIKEQSSWINVAFKDEKEINNNSHICFAFTTKSLNDLASFSNYLVGGNNKEPDFTDRNIFQRSRRIRSTKTSQQIKEEQVNFLLEDVEKKLEECKKALELKDKQLSDIKKILQSAKKKLQ